MNIKKLAQYLTVDKVHKKRSDQELGQKMWRRFIIKYYLIVVMVAMLYSCAPIPLPAASNHSIVSTAKLKATSHKKVDEYTESIGKPTSTYYISSAFSLFTGIDTVYGSYLVEGALNTNKENVLTLEKRNDGDRYICDHLMDECRKMAK